MATDGHFPSIGVPELCSVLEFRSGFGFRVQESELSGLGFSKRVAAPTLLSCPVFGKRMEGSSWDVMLKQVPRQVWLQHG